MGICESTKEKPRSQNPQQLSQERNQQNSQQRNEEQQNAQRSQQNDQQPNQQNNQQPTHNSVQAQVNSNPQDPVDQSNPEPKVHLQQNEEVQKRQAVNKAFVSLKQKTKKEITLENTLINEVNYSAKRITKYFRNQRPYKGDQPFVDELFPPEPRSIFGRDEYGNPVDPDQERVEEAMADFAFNDDEIVFLRPSEVFQGEYAVFEGKIEFDDVRQGAIGNCYFMASISALTECPQIIAEIFRQHDVQSNGYYEICLKIDGEWQVVIVDDYIPCSKQSRTPLFANPKGNELWAILLEKAWAKVNGGYSLTVAGLASEVIECLTNFPYEYNNISNTDHEELWEKIIEASGNEFIMTTALPPREGASDVGLVEGHEYTLQEGQEEIINGQPVRLCKIRNPWGSVNYRGDWGKDSPLWNEDGAKKKFDYKGTYDDEGEFYIKYEDFLYFFADVDICKIAPTICLKQYPISYAESKCPSIFEFHIHKPCNVDFTIFKPYFRFNRRLPTDWTVTQHLFVAKCEDEENMTFSKFWGQCEGQNDCMLTIKDVEPGTYFVYAFVDYSTAKNYETPLEEDVLSELSSMFSVYCSEFFDFHPKGQDREMSIFHRMVAEYCRANPPPVEKGLQVLQQNNFLKSEFYFIYIKNLTGVNIDFTIQISAVGVTMVTFNSKQQRVTLKRDQEYVVVGYCADLYEGHGIGFGYSYKQSASLGQDSAFPRLIQLSECPSDSTDLSLYKWIYKKGDVDYAHILKKIDPIQNAFNHFKHKYPKEVEEVQKIPKLENHDNLGLEVLDKIEFGDGDWYFGECSTKTGEIVMYGRGYAHLSNYNFIGQFVNHSLTGFGIQEMPNGDRLESQFVEFNPVGRGKLKRNDGTVKEVMN